MTLVFDLPECGNSFLKRMDPRWKLAGLMIAALSFTLLRTIGPALAAAVGAILLVAMGRLPWDWYLRRLTTAMVMYLLFLVWSPLVPDEGHELLDLGFVTISWTGLRRLIVLGADLVGLISLMLVLLATTSLPNTFKAARALHVPRVLVFLWLLTYRYVGMLIEEFARLRIALRVRGFRNRADVHSYRTIGQVAGTLLVRSHERSERVGHAMRCRGFDGEFHSLEDFRTAWSDVLVFASIVVYALGLIAWDWSVR